MKLVIFSHKPCWPSRSSSSGYATDGGFPVQMRALSELFDATTVVVPCSPNGDRHGESPLVGHNLSVSPLSVPRGRGFPRKLGIPTWLMANGARLLREIHRADAVHAPIPGDIGTIGILMAMASGKPLFIRHCGNWANQRTTAERFWRWLMERSAGGRNVMMATGGSQHPPSSQNANLSWIFSTSLTGAQLQACAVARSLAPGDVVRLAHVGRQEPAKGTDVVLKSLPLIEKRFPGAMLDVIGSGSALPSLQKLAAELGVRERVVFHGRVHPSRVLELLHQAHLFCFPTTSSEGFPKAVLEALACGLPIITTPVSVLPQLVNTGCGYLLPEATPQAVATAVGSCLSDADQYRVLSAQACRTAAEYSLEQWQSVVGSRLRAAWGELRTDA